MQTHKIPFLIGPLLPHEPVEIAVPSASRELLLEATAALKHNWIQTGSGISFLRFRAYYSHDGQALHSDDSLDVVIHFFQKDGDRYLPLRPTWTEGLSVHAFETPPHSPNVAIGKFDLQKHPIDIVYTWVDSSDPIWRQRMDRALAGVENAREPLHPSAIDTARFHSSDELRFSMRSVFHYADWVRRIYVVTDCQIPSWLDQTHDRVKVVSHSEIMGGSRFNSHAIEASLHRIPGLSEHYLYLNDDVFFGKLACPEDYFFSSGLAKFFPSPLVIDDLAVSSMDRPIIAAAKNGSALLEQRFGVKVRSRIRHTVHPQLRSTLRQLEEEFPVEVNTTRNNLFRSPTDLSVASSLAHWYGYLQGRSIPAKPHYLYVDLAEGAAGKTLDALLSLKRYDTFCLNQEETNPNLSQASAELQSFLQKYFPLPAPWEKDL